MPRYFEAGHEFEPFQIFKHACDGGARVSDIEQQSELCWSNRLMYSCMSLGTILVGSGTGQVLPIVLDRGDLAHGGISK